MLRLFLIHSWRYFIRHKTLTALNIGGIALGIAVYVSVQIVNHSASESFRASIDLVAGRADLEVVGDGLPFAESVYPIVRALPGIEAATPYVEANATLPQHPGEYLQILGLDLFTHSPFRTFRLQSPGQDYRPLDFLSDPASLAISDTLAQRLKVKVGDHLDLRSSGGIRAYRICQLIHFDEDSVGADDHIAVMDIANAQENFKMVGQLTRISCRLDPQTTFADVESRLRQVLPASAIIQPPDRRGHQVNRMLGAFQLNLTALSLISLLVGMFLIYNTVSAAVVRRRSEIGLLRTLGLTGNQVRAFFLAEALVLGTLGLLLGLVLGCGMARLLIGQVSQTISSLYLQLSIQALFWSPFNLLATVTLGYGAVLLAAWFPATEAARIPIIQALQSGHLEGATQESTKRWLAASALCLILAWGIGEVSLHGGGRTWWSFGSALGVLLGFAFVVPSVIKGLAQSIQPPAVTTRLALNQFGQSLHRNAVTIAALVTAIAMLVGISIMIFSFRQTVREWMADSVRADLIIADAADVRHGTRTVLRPEIEQLVKAQPEIEECDTYREIRVQLGDRPIKLAAIKFSVATGRNNIHFVQGQGSEIFARALQKQQILINEALAHKINGQVGDSLVLATPEGTTSFQVAGIFYDYTSEIGLVLVDSGLYQHYWHDATYNSLWLYLRPGASLQATQDRLQQLCAPLGTYLIYSNRQLREQVFRIFDQAFRITYILQTVALIVAGLGIFLNLTIMIAERRREIAILRAVGAEWRQMMSIVLQEAALIGGVGAVLGLGAGVALAYVLSYVINMAFFGWTINWATPWLELASVPVSIVLMAIVAGFWPARQAAALPIAQAIKME